VSRGSVLAAVGLCLGCGAGQAATRPERGIATSFPPEVVAATQHSGQREKAYLVIRSAEEAARAWPALWKSQARPPLMPAVDFSREMLVVAAIGERVGAGFQVTVADALAEGFVLEIGVVETRPGEGCVTESVPTTPAVVARLPRFEGRVEFVEFVVTERCVDGRPVEVPVRP
jgi:hypothetical protein